MGFMVTYKRQEVDEWLISGVFKTYKEAKEFASSYSYKMIWQHIKD